VTTVRSYPPSRGDNSAGQMDVLHGVAAATPKLQDGCRGLGLIYPMSSLKTSNGSSKSADMEIFPLRQLNPFPVSQGRLLVEAASLGSNSAFTLTTRSRHSGGTGKCRPRHRQR